MYKGVLITQGALKYKRNFFTRKQNKKKHETMALDGRKEKFDPECREELSILQDVMNALEDGIMVMDGEFKMAYFNQSLVKLFNMPQDEGLHGSLKEFRVPMEEMMINPRDFFRELEGSLGKEEDVTWNCHLRDGRYLICLIHPFIENRKKYWVVVFRDVTGKKNYDHLLWESRRNYKLLLDHIPDALIVEEGLRCLYANRSAARLFDYQSPEEMIGKDLNEHFTEEGRKRLDERKQSHENPSVELEIKGTHGTKWVEVSNYVYPQEANDWKLTILKDITGEKLNRELRERIQKREEALEKKRMQEQLRREFYANLSHDLKTPINVISAISYMTRSHIENCPPRMKRYLEMLENNCKRLAKIVNESIDLDKVEEGCFRVQRQNYNIVDLVEEVTQSIVPFAERKGLQVVFDTEVEECIIKTDINLVERILLNLLSNSIKFTPSGGNILVGLKILEEEVALLVQDSGVGIQEDELSLIFERYNRGSNTKDHSGSGIGLYIVKKFVELLGGRITAFSEKGRGSAFKVSLPIGEEDGTGMLDVPRSSIGVRELDEMSHILGLDL